VGYQSSLETGETESPIASENAVSLPLVLRRWNLAIIAGVCALFWTASAAAQERRDTTRVDTTRIVPDTTRAVQDTSGPKPELRPPLSPRRAFLYSLALPGYAQSVLGRPRAGALQVTFEAVALVMIGISAADIREARMNRADSIPVSFVNSLGEPGIVYERTPFSSALLRSRQSHLEDWIAVLAANHLFSAADAYVASLLWDLPAEVAVRPAPGGGAAFALHLRW
jgi:hypothetical protein